MWAKAMLMKSGRAFVRGATKVRVMLTRVMRTTAAAVVAAGTQGALATQSGWNGTAHVLTSVVRMAGTGVIKVARAASWVGNQIGKAAGWITGLFHKGTGRKISEGNEKFSNWRTSKLDAAQEKVGDAMFTARAAMTSKVPSRVGRTTAGALGLATAINVATKGAVAAKVATIPAVGAAVSTVFGPVGLLVTGAVAVVGGVAGWLFRRKDVEARMEEIVTKSETTTNVVPIRRETAPAATPIPAPAAPVAQAAKVEEPVNTQRRVFAVPTNAPAEEVGTATVTDDAIVTTAVEETPDGTVTTKTTRSFPEVKVDDIHRVENGFAATFTGSEEALDSLTPEQRKELLDAAMEVQTAEADAPPAEEEVEITDEIVLASFQEVHARPKGEGGVYTDEQMDKRRKALERKHIPMPRIDKAA